MKHKYKDQNDVDVCCDVRVYVNVGCDAGVNTNVNESQIGLRSVVPLPMFNSEIHSFVYSRNDCFNRFHLWCQGTFGLQNLTFTKGSFKWKLNNAMNSN